MHNLREYQQQGYPVPYFFPGAGARGRTTLGDFSLDPSALLASAAAPGNTFSVNSTMLYIGLGLLGVAVIWHYTGKASKSVRRYTRKRKQRSDRIRTLKAELARL